MIRWGIGEVIDVLEENKDLQILLIKTDKTDKLVKAIHYKSFFSSLYVGQNVYINSTATELKLGTGGYDFVVTPFSSIIDNNQEKNGHIMKLRYTPLQFSVQTCEEQSSPYHAIFTEPKTLEGLPVLIGELHSMLPILVTLIRQEEEKRKLKRKKIVYLMTDGAALPLVFSKHVRKLKELGWLDYTITINNAFGGDLEAVNIYTGLIAAKYILKADLVIVLMGPGIVGTGTLLGHTGVEQGTIANAVVSLEGTPIAIVRASLKDKRERQSGISHHTISNLKYISMVRTIIPYPENLKQNNNELYSELLKHFSSKHQLEAVPVNHNEIEKQLKQYPFPISTMGRTLDDDPIFFDFIASTALWVNDYLMLD